MNVIGHDDSYVHPDFAAMFEHHVAKCDVSCARWQDPPVQCSEGDEQWSVELDDVRQVPPIDDSGRDVHSRIVPRDNPKTQRIYCEWKNGTDKSICATSQSTVSGKRAQT